MQKFVRVTCIECHHVSDVWGDWIAFRGNARVYAVKCKNCGTKFSVDREDKRRK
jgi:ribosomal protein S27E